MDKSNLAASQTEVMMQKVREFLIFLIMATGIVGLIFLYAAVMGPSKRHNLVSIEETIVLFSWAVRFLVGTMTGLFLFVVISIQEMMLKGKAVVTIAGIIAAVVIAIVGQAMVDKFVNIVLR